MQKCKFHFQYIKPHQKVQVIRNNRPDGASNRQQKTQYTLYALQLQEYLTENDFNRPKEPTCVGYV